MFLVLLTMSLCAGLIMVYMIERAATRPVKQLPTFKPPYMVFDWKHDMVKHD